MRENHRQPRIPLIECVLSQTAVSLIVAGCQPKAIVQSGAAAIALSKARPTTLRVPDRSVELHDHAAESAQQKTASTRQLDPQRPIAYSYIIKPKLEQSPSYRLAATTPSCAIAERLSASSAACQWSPFNRRCCAHAVLQQQPAAPTSGSFARSQRSSHSQPAEAAAHLLDERKPAGGDSSWTLTIAHAEWRWNNSNSATTFVHEAIVLWRQHHSQGTPSSHLSKPGKRS